MSHPYRSPDRKCLVLYYTLNLCERRSTGAIKCCTLQSFFIGSRQRFEVSSSSSTSINQSFPSGVEWGVDAGWIGSARRRCTGALTGADGRKRVVAAGSSEGFGSLIAVQPTKLDDSPTFFLDTVPSQRPPLRQRDDEGLPNSTRPPDDRR